MWEINKDQDLMGQQRDCARSASSVVERREVGRGEGGRSFTKDIWRRSAKAGRGAGSVGCEGFRLAQVDTQTEQLKRWHQPVDSPGITGWLMNKGAQMYVVFSVT